MLFGKDKEEEAELNRLYPEGSPERRVLEYSRGKKEHDKVPPMLVNAFKLLMGITIICAVISVGAFLTSH